MREYLNITDALDKLGIGAISLSEPFNTETKEGRMMRNNLLNFAEFECETIAAGVADVYATRAVETGFYQGGKKYYGYKFERRTINGKTGSVLVPSERANVIKIVYELYKESSASLQNVIDHFCENKIETDSTSYSKRHEKSIMDRSHLSKLLCSPLYVRADTEIHQLMDKPADADKVLFDYIQKRITELHSKKSELENKLNTRERKNKTIDVQPLAEPLGRWNELTVEEKHKVAVTLIDVITVSNDTGVDIEFSI